MIIRFHLLQDIYDINLFIRSKANRFFHKAGDFNLVIKSYEALQGSDDVKSELTLKFEAFYAEGLQLDGKSFVDYKFNKDGYKEF